MSKGSLKSRARTFWMVWIDIDQVDQKTRRKKFHAFDLNQAIAIARDHVESMSGHLLDVNEAIDKQKAAKCYL